MLIFGVDPGVAITGVAIIEEKINQPSLLYSTAIITTAKTPLSQRLKKLYQALISLMKKYQPDVLVLENLFFNTNAKTALTVGQARGVVQLAAAEKNLPVFEYTPLQVKIALTGYGRADKRQIQTMVKILLKLPKVLTPDDVSDAAAIALTHCFHHGSFRRRTKGEIFPGQIS